MSAQSSDNNKRIAKNTLLLYFRMLFMMVVSLYTSRVILNTLGVEDYGINNVVGGVVTMLAFINNAMSSATQRYITFELGKQNRVRLNHIFSTALQIHGLISLLIFILGETIGLWFFYEKLVIPIDRMNAAMWVYQCSIVSAVVGIMSVPYNADIVAHEKMSAFAYISVLETILKLVIVYLLVISPFDKLKTYSILFLCVGLLIRYIYGRYCTKHFEEAKYRHTFDIPLLKEMIGFAGWSFFGNFAAVLQSQGVNMMLNIFFGPVVNAARGVAVQVQGVVQQFVTNFQMALNPQITKNYATNNLKEMHILMFRSARFSFFLLFFLCLPVIFEADCILQIWLGIVPKNTVVFLRIILCTSLIYTIANPMIIANQATGKVKRYQAICGTIMLMILPVSYIFLKMGMHAYVVFIVHFCMEAFCQVARMLLLRNLIQLSIKQYLLHIYKPIFLVVALSVVIPYIVYSNMDSCFLRLVFVGMACVISVGAMSFFFGLEKSERQFLKNKIMNRVKMR